MSKFMVKIKLKELEIEVEGSSQDAPKISQQIGKQIGGLLQPALLAPGTPPIIDAEPAGENGSGRAKGRTRKSGGNSGSRTTSETISLSHDSATYGTPLQGWTTVPKAIWFLYIVSKQTSATQMTANNIAKNFNHHFRAAGIIQRGNVSAGLEKERVKGATATVNADMSDGPPKYFLTQAGIAMAEKLVKGEVVTE